jgi:hypothetical protein
MVLNMTFKRDRGETKRKSGRFAMAALSVAAGAFAVAAFASAEARAAETTPWTVLLTLEASPDRIEVIDQAVSSCGAPDHVKGGADLVAEVRDAEGALVSSIGMIDFRMIFVEPPEEGIRYQGPALTRVGDRQLANQLTRVLRLPLAEGDQPALPVRIALRDARGELLFEREFGPQDVVAADELGCELPVLPDAPQDFDFTEVVGVPGR